MGPEVRLDGSRTERKKKETREKIVKAAMDLFRDQGFNNTTMEQIAAKADVARKTLYNHFLVKEAIADEYVRGISKELARENLETFENLPDTRSRLLATMNHVYEWVEINPEITGICLGYRIRKMAQEPGDSSDKTGTQNVLSEIISQGQQAGEIRQDISSRLLEGYINILRFVLVLDWLNVSPKYNLLDETAKLVDLFMHGATEQKNL